MRTPVLDIAALRVGYATRSGTPLVLDGVSLTIGPGEAVGLVGESGCGKSTLALSLMRALPPGGIIQDGRIVVAGTDVVALSEQQLRRWRGSAAAMVYQDPTSSLTPSLPVGDQVAEVYRYHDRMSRRQALDAAAEMLAQVGLTPRQFLGRYPHQLSGGQRQRVVIAMALAARPRLLVLDEPTTGLDATVQAGILELIDSLRGQFIDALLFITHNLGLVARTCERLSVLYAGRVVEDGPVSDVLSEPAHPYTTALLGCLPAGRRAGLARLPAIPGSPPRPGEELTGCKFAPRCTLATEACKSAEPELTSYPARLAGGGALAGRTVRCITPGPPARPSLGSASPPATTPAAASASEVLLELRGVGKRYGNVVACEGIDLTVHRNQTVGLVGESGSGKTTVARIVAGLTASDSGQVLWAGDKLASLVGRRPRAVARALQLVPQHPDSTLNPRHRVRSILARAVKRLGGDLPVGQLAAAVRLEPHHLDSRAHELSGGLRQRAAIARAFAGRPELVICDEPVSSLDVSVQAVILNLLADLQADRGTSYLFISHDLAVVRYLAHTVAVIYGGQIVETGPADQVFAVPRHPYTDALLAAEASTDLSTPVAATVRHGAQGDDDAAGPPASGCTYQRRCPIKAGQICATQAPPLRLLPGDHQIRCHHEPSVLTALQRALPSRAEL